MAAQLDDLTDAPVDYQDYASEAEELADLTADNRIAELATTDNKILAEVFADIDTGEIPFMLSGYTEDDYGNIVTALSEALHTKEPSSDPDAEIPAPAAPVTQYGDLWILGRHRVLCGDCTRHTARAAARSRRSRPAASALSARTARPRRSPTTSSARAATKT